MDKLEAFFFGSAMVALGGVVGVLGAVEWYGSRPPEVSPVVVSLDCDRYGILRRRDGTIVIRIPPETD